MFIENWKNGNIRYGLKDFPSICEVRERVDDEMKVRG